MLHRMDGLGPLLRLALGGSTEGEQIAALNALARKAAAAGLDIHAIADRLDTERTTPEPTSTSTAPGPESASAADYWEQACSWAATQFTDDDWEPMACIIIEHDDAAHAACGRWLLTGRQRKFVEEMAEHAQVVRLTAKQGAYLFALACKCLEQRATPSVDNRVGERPGPAGMRRQRIVPQARSRPEPKRLVSREEQLRWIAAVAETRHASGLPLFSDAQARVLSWFAARHDVWTVARADHDIRVGFCPSGAEIAAGAHASLRTVRETLKRAVTAGYLIAERGGGRGRRTRYTLAQPPDRWRRADMPQRPRRQGRRDV